jgi:hypothetical protein
MDRAVSFGDLGKGRPRRKVGHKTCSGVDTHVPELAANIENPVGFEEGKNWAVRGEKIFSWGRRRINGKALDYGNCQN